MECVVVSAFVTDEVVVARHEGIDEKFDAAQVIAGGQLSATGDHVFGDGIQGNIRRIATRLVASSIGVKVQMTNWFKHAITWIKDGWVIK